MPLMARARCYAAYGGHLGLGTGIAVSVDQIDSLAPAGPEDGHLLEVLDRLKHDRYNL